MLELFLHSVLLIAGLNMILATWERKKLQGGQGRKKWKKERKGRERKKEKKRNGEREKEKEREKERKKIKTVQHFAHFYGFVYFFVCFPPLILQKVSFFLLWSFLYGHFSSPAVWHPQDPAIIWPFTINYIIKIICLANCHRSRLFSCFYDCWVRLESDNVQTQDFGVKYAQHTRRSYMKNEIKSSC